MSDLLLELFSEEIPARMQAQAAKDLERLVAGALSDRGLLFEGIKAFAGPRRLTLAVAGLPAKQPDVKDEKKGPRVNAPAKAIEGFLRSAGVKLEDCEQRDDGKGPFYVAVIDLKGRATADVIAEFLPEVLGKLPWPKSMRWPQKSNNPVRWVRPLHSILCTLDGDVVEFAFAGVESGNTTKGHRFLSSGTIAVKRFEDYREKLHAAHVILDAEERKAIIFEGVKQAAFIHGLEMIRDEGLLDEVAGLAEWPVVLLGQIENQFMDVPAEILQTSMRTHQKYFSLRDPATGKFANMFAVVANMIAADGGKQIVAGNERVLRARLSDAKFFWDQDRKVPLADRVSALGGIVFHAKLGTQLERVERIEALAGEIAEKIGADVKKAKRAARLSKADLTSGVVGEFPELQGVMGRYYALNDNEDPEVADAVRDHYKPLGPTDAVATNKIAIAVALADKLEQLTDFFAVDEKPTGSSDPFALRRAALGFIRTVLENKTRLNVFSLVRAIFDKSLKINSMLRNDGGDHQLVMEVRFHRFLVASSVQQRTTPFGHEEHDRERLKYRDFVFKHISEGLLAFLADRMAVALRDRGTRYDLVNAVFSLGDQDDLVRLVARVEALQAFLKSDDGANLLAGYKRAANILKVEEKKDDHRYGGEVIEDQLAEPQEKALFAALTAAKGAIAPALEREDFAGAMREMAGLRAPVDAFFDKVKVNADDKIVRTNRLNLLAALRATLHQVADFSKIEG
ncbi:MAG: glycine--tRNA ligase subunit beta [Alphaproteobacteria bacterium]|nr:glycine--tRNA ligase subunit beta [Alphaproteobacteria bacterium]MBL6936273.1 glycine--tRNA ligase subunit beta [Alphaproteobacteria bacterium]MBL7098676.1 glycine--tRNA ligase subunit beta [Alphaproteobacteria bacterium]